MNLLRLRFLPAASLLVFMSGCSAEESARFGLTILAMFGAPLFFAQCVIAGPAFVGRTIATPASRGIAIFLSAIVTTLMTALLVFATDEIIGLSRQSRLNLAMHYVLTLAPATASFCMFGSLFEAAPPELDVEGFPIPKRRVLSLLWAGVGLIGGAALSFYVFW